jgi:hypothetical protein
MHCMVLGGSSCCVVCLGYECLDTEHSRKMCSPIYVLVCFMVLGYSSYCVVCLGYEYLDTEHSRKMCSPIYVLVCFMVLCYSSCCVSRLRVSRHRTQQEEPPSTVEYMGLRNEY